MAKNLSQWEENQGILILNFSHEIKNQLEKIKKIDCNSNFMYNIDILKYFENVFKSCKFGCKSCGKGCWWKKSTVDIDSHILCLLSTNTCSKEEVS